MSLSSKHQMATNDAAEFRADPKGERRLAMRTVLIALAAMLSLTANALAQEPVSQEMVNALRQLAIDAGQTTSSKAAPPQKSAEEIAKAKARLESSRAAFFERTYGRNQQ